MTAPALSDPLIPVTVIELPPTLRAVMPVVSVKLQFSLVTKLIVVSVPLLIIADVTVGGGGTLLVTAVVPAAILRLLATLVMPFVAANVSVTVSVPRTLRFKVIAPAASEPLIPVTERASAESVKTVIPVVVAKVQFSLVTMLIVFEVPASIVAEAMVGAPSLTACSMTPTLDNHTLNHLQYAVKVHFPKTSKTPAPKPPP